MAIQPFLMPAACQLDDYGSDASCHGILVQLPLPDHIDEEFVLDRISVDKDVDGSAHV